MIYKINITEYFSREGFVTLEADSRQDAVRKVRRAVKDNCLAVTDYGNVKGHIHVHRKARSVGEDFT